MDVINEGSDAGQMKPMMDEYQSECGPASKNLLTDGGFSTVQDIEATTAGGTRVYTPVKEETRQKEAGKDPFAEAQGYAPSSPNGGSAWDQRGKELYKLPAPTAELPNARVRNQGVYQVRVRGRDRPGPGPGPEAPAEISHGWLEAGSEDRSAGENPKTRTGSPALQKPPTRRGNTDGK